MRTARRPAAKSLSKNKSVSANRPRETCDVLVTGTGSLAESTLLAWPDPGAPKVRHRIVILSRTLATAEALATLASLRAAASGCELDCSGAATDWTEASLRQLLAEHRPRLVLHAASFQSPWPKEDDSSPWRREFMRGLGFGVTTALQSVLAFRVARALAAVSPESALVNCCYPDAVNPLLALGGLPITCGAGNVSIVDAVWRSRMPSSAIVRTLAHHAHLTQLVRPESGPGVYPRVWLGNTEHRQVAQALAGVKFPPGRAMNHLTGAVTARLGHALLGRKPVRQHVPGPAGLVGGYPVVARAGRVTLDLPRGISEAQAVAFNARAQIAEGIQSIGRQGLRYIPALADALERHGSRFPAGFGPDDVEAAAADMAGMRAKLGGTAP